MRDLAWSRSIQCVHDLRDKGLVVLGLVLRYVYDNDSEPQFREIVLELESLIDGHEGVKLVLDAN